MNPRVTWWTEKARKRIVGEAKRILEEIGVFVENEEAMNLLEGAGARVDRAKRQALIPASLVHKAVGSAPSKVALYNRRGEQVMDLGGDRVHFNPGSAALRIYDMKERRARDAARRRRPRRPAAAGAPPWPEAVPRAGGGALPCRRLFRYGPPPCRSYPEVGRRAADSRAAGGAPSGRWCADGV